MTKPGCKLKAEMGGWGTHCFHGGSVFFGWGMSGRPPCRGLSKELAVWRSWRQGPRVSKELACPSSLERCLPCGKGNGLERRQEWSCCPLCHDLVVAVNPARGTLMFPTGVYGLHSLLLLGSNFSRLSQTKKIWLIL